MNEKLEQVKRALIKHEGDNLSKALDDAFWESTARAAIEAMREPTEAMMAEHSQIQITGYRSMIDEALS